VCGLNVVVSARTGVTEVYGDLSDIDDIDWMKISNVDVSFCVFSFDISLISFKIWVKVICDLGISFDI